MASYVKFRRTTYDVWKDLPTPRDPNTLYLMPSTTTGSDDHLIAFGDNIFTALNATTGLSGDAVANEIVLTRQNGTDLVVSNLPFLVDGIIPANQLPISIDKIERYNTVADFPTTGAENIVYKDIEKNDLYRWDGVEYQVVGDFISLGETSSTAYRGDRGALAFAERGSQIAGDWITWLNGKLHVDHPIFAGVDGGSFLDYNNTSDYTVDGGEF